jgi:hypothetical protein
MEQKIRDLCGRAIASPADQVDAVLFELRQALDEHFKVARESLGKQAAAISILDRATLESSDQTASE